jgi:hypothetical protein
VPFIEVQRSLEAWWEAVGKVDDEPPGSDARRRAEERAEARRLEYHAALLRAIGIVDQLDAATRATVDRLGTSRELLDSGRRYIRLHRAPDRSGR